MDYKETKAPVSTVTYDKEAIEEATERGRFCEASR